MSIELLAFDLDGTLVNMCGDISWYERAARSVVELSVVKNLSRRELYNIQVGMNVNDILLSYDVGPTLYWEKILVNVDLFLDSLVEIEERINILV